MTQQEAKELFKKSSDFAVNYYDHTEVVSLNQVDIVLNQIYNDHEAQLKAKDIAIELLANVCKLGLETQDKYRIIIKAKDDEIRRLNNLYADTIKDLGDALIEIERLKKQYHQCLDDYIKCAERKEQ